MRWALVGGTVLLAVSLAVVVLAGGGTSCLRVYPSLGVCEAEVGWSQVLAIAGLAWGAVAVVALLTIGRSSDHAPGPR